MEKVLAEKPDQDVGDFRVLTIIVVIIGLLLSSGLVASQGHGLIAAIGIGVEIFIASAAVGVVLGFLFAVPRVLTQSPDTSTGAKVGGAKGRFLESNTNLESISDWLTTMLVGVGISQLFRVNDALLGFRNYIEATARVFDGSAGTLPAIAPLLLITGAVSGFIAMYLYTRLNLAKLFSETESYLRGDARRAVVSAARSLEPDGSFAAAVAASGNVTSEDALDLMFDLLYKPNGYRRVIDLAAQLSHSPLTKSATYWFYLAAAFGQQLKDAKQKKDKALAESAKENALDAAQRAVRIDSSYRSRLWNISNPEGPDDDLAELREDSRFLALVRRKN